MPRFAAILTGYACLLGGLAFIAAGALATWATSDRRGKPDAGTTKEDS
jgi:hypothetical protein